MSYSRLSQAEIDMLLGGGMSASQDNETLSQADMDTVGEIGAAAMNSAATTMSSLVGQNVALTNPRVSVMTLEQYCSETPLAVFIASVQFLEGFSGDFYLTFQDLDSRVIVDLLFGNDGSAPPEQLDDIQLSGLSEVVSQVAGTMMTTLSTLFKKKVTSGPTAVRRYDLSVLETPIGITLDDSLAKVVFRFELGELCDSLLTLLLPLPLAKEMVHAFEAATMPMPEPPPRVSQPVESSQPAWDTSAISAPAMPASQSAAAPQSYAYPPQQAMPFPENSAQHLSGAQAVNAQPVFFQPFGQNAAPQTSTGNLNLILDVPLQVTVELGRTKRPVRDVLDLGAGSIIELDKLTGDPVDILINGKPIAEGEVVIIDENFAVRITKIKNVADRLGMLQ